MRLASCVTLCVITRDPFYWHSLTQNSAWIGDYNHVKQWDVITHPSPNYNDGLIKAPYLHARLNQNVVEVKIWMSNYISFFHDVNVITYLRPLIFAV